MSTFSRISLSSEKCYIDIGNVCSISEINSKGYNFKNCFTKRPKFGQIAIIFKELTNITFKSIITDEVHIVKCLVIIIPEITRQLYEMSEVNGIYLK